MKRENIISRRVMEEPKKIKVFSKEKEYMYAGKNIGKFKRYRPVKDFQTYIWNGYAYFENWIVTHSEFHLVKEVE